MASCCEDKHCAITAMQERHGRVLWVVLLINAVMFLVEGGAGLMAHSTSLLADALDMLVGVVTASLFLSLALQVLRPSMQALRTPLAAVQRSVELSTTDLPQAKP
jgi:Co/Zn/Cd efflux system component